MVDIIFLTILSVLWFYIFKEIHFTNQHKESPKEEVKYRPIIVETRVESERMESPRKVIEKLRGMHPKDFEEFVELLLQLAWYKTLYKSQRIKRYGKRYARKDWWIDIICRKWESKKYIQIKKYINQELSVTVIREMRWVCWDELWPHDECIIITTSLFSEDALKFSKQKNISTIDYEKLLEIIDEISSDQNNRQKIIGFINKENLIKNTEFMWLVKTCPICLAPLVKRKWWFYWCMNYYKKNCRYIE